MQERSSYDSCTIEQNPQEAQSKEEVRLTSAKLDEPVSSWLATNKKLKNC